PHRRPETASRLAGWARATCGGPGRAEPTPEPGACPRAARRAAPLGPSGRAPPGAHEADRGLASAPPGGQTAPLPDETAAPGAGRLTATRTHPGRARVYRLKIMAPISVTLARRDPPAAVVALVGEHDAYSAQRLENELAVLLEEGRRIVVDLRDTEFIDSTTLSVLLVARHRAAHSSLGFALLLPDRTYPHV